jgi:hypothetical protein
MNRVSAATTFRAVVLACCGLWTPAIVSAQTAPSTDAGFSALGRPGTSIEVVESAGNRTRGRLLRVDADSFTIRRGGREVRFDRQQVEEVYQRGDSLKSGLLTGLGFGAALGFIAGLSNDHCGALLTPHPCTSREKWSNAAIAGGLLGSVGMGIGVGIDALFTGRRLLYFRQHAGVATIRLAPVARHSGAGLLVAATW